ncbi:MAG: hypothetical protein ACRBBS_08045 [Thalassovita sp.]
MTKTKEMEELAELTGMVFSARSVEMQRLSAREQKLRDRYETLEKQRQTAQGQAEDVLSQRLTGLDVLYQMWVGRQMAAINTELAQVLAEKEMRLQNLRTAFGKKEVALQLLRQQKAIKRPAGQDW